MQTDDTQWRGSELHYSVLAVKFSRQDKGNLEE